MIGHRFISKLDLEQACRINDSIVQEHESENDGQGARHISAELGVDLLAIQMLGAEFAGRSLGRGVESVKYCDAIQLICVAYTIGVLTALRASHILARESSS